jgi:AcrR family transcriptional regulator
LTPRGEETRKQLIDYATHCFTQSGYHATSVAQILEGLGFGRGVFYWYFSSKEELFASLLDAARRDVRAVQDAAVADEPDALRRIELYIRATITWTVDNAERSRLFGIAEADSRLRVHREKGRAEALRVMERMVRAGMSSGQIPRDDATMIAAAIMAILLSITHYVRQGRSAEEVADTVVRLTLNGISADSRRAFAVGHTSVPDGTA